MKVLFVSSEVAPFAKTGGLADVAGSLPREIKTMGHDIRIIMPEYGKIEKKYKEKFAHILHFRTNVAWRNEYVGINKLESDGVPVYFVDNKNYFDRSTLYENGDRDVQFAYFARAVLEFLPGIDFKPDIIHCNDWQTGLIGLMLEDNYRQFDFYRDIKTVFTIHNLQYQGRFSPRTLYDVLGVDEKHWYEGNIRHDGLINYMKCGIMYADAVTTVSETYAREIKTEYFGEELDYALRLRGDDLYGIVNGISYDKFDPATDKNIYYNYNSENLAGKSKNKEELQREMNLPVNGEIPIISIITRLVKQKGLDLIKTVFAELMESDIHFILLGTGEDKYENFFREKAVAYPDKLAVNIKYDFSLARRIYAGSDIFLMPSLYEPCGLGQIISMRYGTIPVVRETGGLNDTVLSYNLETDTGYGFTFTNYNAHDMLYTLRRALYFYNRDSVWKKVVKRAMRQDFSWKNSAQKYVNLYSQLIGHKEAQLEGEDSRVTAGKIININKASIKELQQLPGIGSTYAARIIVYREKEGKFTEKEELKNIKGLSAKKYDELKEKIKVR